MTTVSIVSSQPTVPGTYVLLLMDVAERWNISADKLLAGEGLTGRKLKGEGVIRFPRPPYMDRYDHRGV